MPFVLLLSAGFIAQFLFLALYLAQENAVPFWDYAMYANMAIVQFLAGGFESFAQSFAQNYNLLFALPSFFSFSLFEPSRTVFILTNFAVYGLAYQIATGYLLHRAFAFSAPKAFLWALGACSLVPFLWYPLLQGYPDLGAAASLVFALALGCVQRQSLKKAIAFGLFVGLAIVFRRHYAYAGLALLAAGFLVDLPAWRSKGFWIQHVTRGATAFSVLLVIEPAYVQEMLTANYDTLYQSYERAPGYFFHFVTAHAGLVLLLCTALGWFAAWRKKLISRHAFLFVLFAVLLWLGLWGFGPAQAGQHYLIALLPPFFIVGLAALFSYLKKRARVLSGVLLLALIANAAFCFWLAPRFVLPSDPPALALFGTPRPPWIRSDVQTLTALADYIAQTTGDEDRIAVSGSSFIFNQDLVRALYTDVLRDPAPAARFIPAPESDGDQEPPLHVYAAANVYLASSPAQFHLDPAKQKHVAAFAAQFPPAPEIATLFTKDEKTFTLERGVTVSVWRRKAWTPEKLSSALAGVRRLSNTTLPWVFAQGGTQAALLFNSAQETTSGLLLLSRLEPKAHLFFDRAFSAGAYRASFSALSQNGCGAITARAALQSPGGRVLAEQSVTALLPAFSFDFPFSIAGSAGAFLSLYLTQAGENPCLLKIQNLQTRPKGSKRNP